MSKTTLPRQFFVLRELRSSELGWFAAVRREGREGGAKQRAINFNASVMDTLFPEGLDQEEIEVVTRRHSDRNVTRRPLRRQKKNWRLVGNKVEGRGLEGVQAGDFFWGLITVQNDCACALDWDVVTRSGSPVQHAALRGLAAGALPDGMAAWSHADPFALSLQQAIGLRRDSTLPPPEAHDAPQPLKPPRSGPPLRVVPQPPSEPARPKRKRLDKRLVRPHILTEILKSGLSLSANAQAEFMDVLDTLADTLRQTLMEAGKLQKVHVDHRATWQKFQGHKIGFVDGGVANVTSLGSAPLAIRVGSYVVTPGGRSQQRERFAFDVQLVDELYDSAGTGVYEEGFDDVMKLRDAARYCCEAAGALAMLQSEKPSMCILHGPLVIPVSPYALEDFPSFTSSTAQKLLPGGGKRREGRAAQFVSVYREQLRMLEQATATVCGVVERPTSATPGILTMALLEQLKADGYLDGTSMRTMFQKLREYRITDPILLECVLDEAEYIAPVALDKQGPDNKIPTSWAMDIKGFPRPLTTYVKPHAETMPIRVEAFRTGPFDFSELLQLIVHMSRLLPRYSFPVGLDIVDKHAKVPEWMSRQMNVMLTAQLMRRAMDSGNPAVIRMARRIVSANTRDWLFRPDFRRS
ncbi:DNA double-strand break repair nuclease NurA [Myxococcus sp. RHSTA-1-4]|uniref:DNA double-strand break repair nuclease NurA n=1 Tax=Myxococcus sp. RHSTA-1-4 TaxID=2874601 RepID=UPI001CBEA83F|nr:DNA double-strand break repair nuclease NurA [Myxococcus sp. RHSTA-1-4]MBZ4416002.1 DNA double-strand break repair nuclease NurA [Myxococcus sp. RHSTA-1-4]